MSRIEELQKQKLNLMDVSFQWAKLAQSDQIKLELGSGRKSGKDGWTTVDEGGADINYDLRKGIPLKDESVHAIYTSHMFEHMPYKQLVVFIEECKRVLRKGGYLSVCVPNAGYYIRAYVEGKNFREQDSLHKPSIVDTGSFLDQVNYIAYMGGTHAYLFDEENLIKTLRKGGFVDVKMRSFDPDVDLIERDFESIYAVAVK